MTLLPILMLAAGLNAAIAAIASPTPASSHAQHAEAFLNRSVATVEPRLRRQALECALADSRRGFNRMLARQIAATRVRPQSVVSSAHILAKVTLDRMVNTARTRLAARAVDNAMRENLRDYSRMLAREISASGPAREVAREAANRDGKTMPFTSPR